MSECPSDVREVDAAGDSRVLIDVARIVVVNEIVSECLNKDGPRQDDETYANPSGDPRYVSPLKSG
jgi:hypothetical protein